MMARDTKPIKIPPIPPRIGDKPHLGGLGGDQLPPITAFCTWEEKVVELIRLSAAEIMNRAENKSLICLIWGLGKQRCDRERFGDRHSELSI